MYVRHSPSNKWLEFIPDGDAICGLRLLLSKFQITIGPIHVIQNRHAKENGSH